MSQLLVGTPVIIDSSAPVGPFAAVFEDNAETGYFYALDPRVEAQPILDALLVYNVASVIDRNLTSELGIAWSSDGARVVLYINGHAHAGFDFTGHRGYCRSNFPPTSTWSVGGHAWDETVASWAGPAA
jgi:hypothetical protein